MHILDLPEIIFLHVFRYFEDSAVYFTLRRVCRRFRSCSDSYIKLEAKLLLFRDAVIPRCALQSLTPSILYLFKKNQMIVPFSSKLNLLADMWPPKTYIQYLKCFEDGEYSATFGLESDGRIVIGTYCFSGIENNKFMQPYFYYEYIQHTKQWIRQSPASKDETCTTRGIILGKCTIENSDLVFFETGLHIVELREKTKPRKITNFINTLLQNVRTDSIDQKCHAKSLRYIGTGNVFNCIRLASIVPITKEKFILVAPNLSIPSSDLFNYHYNDGNTQREDQENLKSISMMKMWEGEILENESCVRWSEIEMNRADVDSRHLRVRPICFKLKDSIYIVSSLVYGEYSDSKFSTQYAGSFYSMFGKEYLEHYNNNVEYKARSTCDRYDIIKKKYYTTDYCYSFEEYPLQLCGSHRVVTNKEETLAVILTSNLKSRQLLIFTEKGGFQAYVEPYLNGNGEFKDVQSQS
jgi:hypothetical protein